jgi:hypothetical protein
MLREKSRVKTVIGATDLSLTMEANQSARVVRIYVDTPVSAWASVTVDKLLVAYIHVSGTQGNHAPFPVRTPPVQGLYNRLIQDGIFRPIPLAKGQTLKITGVATALAKCSVVYDVFDPEDVKETEPNGTKSGEYDFLSYGSFSGTLATGDNQFTTQQSSAQYPAFPWGKAVPAKTQMTLRGIAFNDYGERDGTGAQITTFLKIVRNREVLFDEDRNGLPYRGVDPVTSGTKVGLGQAMAGNLSDVDFKDFLRIDPALIFKEGEDLDIYATTSVLSGAGTIANTALIATMIFNVSQLR